MRKLVVLLVAVPLFGGCATTNKGDSGGFMQRYSESRKLTHAVELIGRGDSAGAARTLTALCNGSALPGVTDEALFRLALLSLKPNAEKPASAHANQLLKRLKKEYPASPWTAQAAPLVELINIAEESKRPNRSLKSSNQTLSKEISELTKNLEQLKHLDVELEQKTR